MEWKRLLVLAGGTAGLAAAMYLLLKEGPENKQLLASLEEKALKVEDVTKEQVRQILKEIVESQEKMRDHMKVLTTELLAKQVPFEQVYRRVQEVKLEDPLERYGLSSLDFDQLLNKYQDDVQVRDGIRRIMGMPDPSGTGPDEGSSIPCAQVVELHAFMLQELEQVVRHYSTVNDKDTYEQKTVTLAAQAVVAAKVEEKFGVGSDDIERAVIKHHEVLATHQEFANINMKMQQLMSMLMGSPEHQ